VYDDDVRVPTEDRKRLGRLAEERRYATPADFSAGTYAERTIQHYDSLGRRDTVTITNGSGQTIRQELSGFDTQNRLVPRAVQAWSHPYHSLIHTNGLRSVG
jgi:hypothetical protein